MKKILICLLLVHISFVASDRLSRVDIAQMHSVQNAQRDDFEGLDYPALMRKRLQHQERVDSVSQSLVILDEQIKQTQQNFNTYSQLFQKEEELMLITQMDAVQNKVSFDCVYALLAKYKKEDKKQTLSVDDRCKMNYMDAYLKEYEKQINKVVSNNKNVDISKILASWPCNQIKANLTALCLDHQQRMLALYQNNIQQYQDELAALSSQKKSKIQEQSLIYAAVAKMDALIPELLAFHNAKIAKDTKSVTLLQSLYRMKLAQKQPQIVAWQKYRAMKSEFTEPMLDDLCDRVFALLESKKQAEENAKLLAEWHKQKLFDQQERDRKKAEKIHLQKEAEITKETLRLQEIAIVKIQKAYARKIARMAEKEQELKIIADQEVARLKEIEKNDAEIALLDTLIQEKNRNNPSNLVTLADRNVIDIKNVFHEAVKSEKPLSKAMSVVIFYVEQFGVSDFDGKIFLDNAVEYARLLKQHDIPGDTKRRSAILQDIFQEVFESIINNDQKCVSPCSDQQAANLAKVHNLLVDFLEDNLNL